MTDVDRVLRQTQHTVELILQHTAVLQLLLHWLRVCV